jgi:hypothetical protein
VILTLVPHPAFAPRSVEEVSVQVERMPEGGLWLEYFVKGPEQLVLPQGVQPQRAEGLWNSTCFELFVMRSGSAGYSEFNFSPSFEWAVYGFDGYRTGMHDLAAVDPEIEIASTEDFFFLAAEPWPPELTSGELIVGLSAIVEETDGIKSYWALAHPPGEPDFHHPDCFALKLLSA